MNVNNHETVDANDYSITDELPIVQSSTNGVSQTERGNISTPRPSFYAICKQCWTVNEPSRERTFYKCLEGKCQEHASHTGENNSRVTKAMLARSLYCTSPDTGIPPTEFVHTQRIAYFFFKLKLSLASKT